MSKNNINYIICPDCASISAFDGEHPCTACGSTRAPIMVNTQLIEVVKLLIKMGFGVTGTDYKYCTSHKTKITISIYGAVPVQLFSDLPNNWRLQCLIETVYYLRCNEEDPNTMINNLEEWLKNKDADGIKAVLRLAGYDKGQ